MAGASDEALANAVPMEKIMERADAAMAAMRRADMSLLPWFAPWSVSLGWAWAVADMVVLRVGVVVVHG
jgi:hypothetical protein